MSPDTNSSSSATSIPPPELPFRIKLGVTGHGLVEIDGVDLSNKISALSFDAAPSNVNRLVLQLAGDADLEGFARVTVVNHDVGAALADIDPDELEAEALRRVESFDDRSLTAVMLGVLSEWLHHGR